MQPGIVPVSIVFFSNFVVRFSFYYCKLATYNLIFPHEGTNQISQGYYWTVPARNVHHHVPPDVLEAPDDGWRDGGAGAGRVKTIQNFCVT